MYERITRNIVPPEMAALLLPVHDSPKVKGYIFKRGSMGMYHANGTHYLTRVRGCARVYSYEEVCQNSRNGWSWGNKAHGTWVTVYE